MYGKTFQSRNCFTLFPNEALLRYFSGLKCVINKLNFMFVHYSIIKLLMVFEVLAQREHTIVVVDTVTCDTAAVNTTRTVVPLTP